MLQPGESARLPRLAVAALHPRPEQPREYQRQEVPVTNLSGETATAESDGRTVTITVPAGFTVQAERTAVRYEPDGAYRTIGAGTRCDREAGAPNIAVCDVGGAALTPIALRFTAAPTTGTALSAGCNNITVPVQEPRPALPTPMRVAELAQRVAPPGALEAIWKYEPALGRFFAYAPSRNAPNNLMTVNPLASVWICVRAPAMLVQPGDL